MKVVIKDLEGFWNVFGAEGFVKNFPELLNGKGIEIKKHNDFYYVVDENGDILHDSCFFSEEELQYLEIIDGQETLH